MLCNKKPGDPETTTVFPFPYKGSSEEQLKNIPTGTFLALPDSTFKV
jgi:hypothetical protein